MKKMFSSHHSSPPAPVSDVDLSISCLANGEWRLRCSSNGDSPQYSWYLDGRPLSEADADLSADNQTLLLSRNVTGELTCSVSNRVSSTNISALLLDACSGQLVGHYFTSEWFSGHDNISKTDIRHSKGQSWDSPLEQIAVCQNNNNDELWE